MRGDNAKTYGFRDLLQVRRFTIDAMQDIFVLEVQCSRQDRVTTELDPLSICRECIREYYFRIEEFHGPSNGGLNQGGLREEL